MGCGEDVLFIGIFCSIHITQEGVSSSNEEDVSSHDSRMVG